MGRRIAVYGIDDFTVLELGEELYTNVGAECELTQSLLDFLLQVKIYVQMFNWIISARRLCFLPRLRKAISLKQAGLI